MIGRRKYPIGSEITSKLGIDFRVWAPNHQKVDLVLENSAAQAVFYPMERKAQGYFSVCGRECTADSFRSSVPREHRSPDPERR